MAQSRGAKITIVELGHNSYRDGQYSGNVEVDAARFDQLLADPGQVDCPLAERAGLPRDPCQHHPWAALHPTGADGGSVGE